MTKLPEPHRLILQLCIEDHVGLWFLLGHVEDYHRGDPPEVVKSKTLEVIGDLLKAGLVTAGHPTADGKGFDEWKLAPEESIARIDKEWRGLGHTPSIGDIVWFYRTPAGMKVNRS